MLRAGADDAKDGGMLKVGRVSVDGTHMRANASIDKNLTPDRAAKIRMKIKEDVAELQKQVELADEADTEEDGTDFPKHCRVARRSPNGSKR